jgi:predicted nucleotidyltransferase
VSRPKVPSFGAGQRSRLARRAATARWARLGRGVLTLAQIRDAVAKALAERGAKAAAGVPRRSFFLPSPTVPGEREAEAPGKRKRKPKAYLFGSYARGDATARSDLDIMVIVKKMPEDLLGETADLTSAIHEALGGMGDKEIDLILTDEATFNDYKDARSTVYYDVHREGVRLV